MYINLKQKVECSKCGSENYENFSDDMYRGIRCKWCGHESKELHEHLRPQPTEGTSYRWISSNNPRKF